MFNANKTLVASAIAAMGLSYAMTAAAQPPAWLADEGPIDIIGDIVVNNTPKDGSASNFGCKVLMTGEILGVDPGTGNTDFRIDNVSARNNGWDATFSTFCNAVTTGGSLPWTGSIDPATMNVTINGIFFNAVHPFLPPQPGCGPAGTLTGQWRQTTTLSQLGDLRSAYSVIHLANGVENPTTPIVDAGPGDCLIGGTLNVTRPTGPLVQ